MQYRDRIVSHLPEIRRFAGALIAPGHPHSTGAVDELVARAATFVLRERIESETALRIALYSAIVRMAQGRDTRAAAEAQPPGAPPSFANGLLSLQVQHRAALLLVSLEQLSYEEAAEVLGISKTFLVAKLSTARQMLARRMQSAGERPVAHLRLVK